MIYFDQDGDMKLHTRLKHDDKHYKHIMDMTRVKMTTDG